MKDQHIWLIECEIKDQLISAIPPPSNKSLRLLGLAWLE
jgi:hypothetical protein